MFCTVMMMMIIIIILLFIPSSVKIPRVKNKVKINYYYHRHCVASLEKFSPTEWRYEIPRFSVPRYFEWQYTIIVGQFLLELIARTVSCRVKRRLYTHGAGVSSKSLSLGNKEKNRWHQLLTTPIAVFLSHIWCHMTCVTGNIFGYRPCACIPGYIATF